MSLQVNYLTVQVWSHSLAKRVLHAASDLPVRAVAERLVHRVLAAAEIGVAGLGRGPALGGHVVGLVRAVAERLFLRQAAGAPRVGFAGLDGHLVRRFLGDRGMRHAFVPLLSAAARGPGWRFQ